MASAEVSVVHGEANLSRRVEARSTNDVVLAEPRVRNRCTRFPRITRQARAGGTRTPNLLIRRKQFVVPADLSRAPKCS